MMDDRPLFLSHPRMVRARAGVDALLMPRRMAVREPPADGPHWPGTLAGLAAIAVGGAGWFVAMAWIGSVI